METAYAYLNVVCYSVIVYTFPIFKQDSENDHIYHSELFTLTKRMAKGESQKISFTVPIFEPHPAQYYIRAVSDSWLRSESLYTISFHNLTLPEVWIWMSDVLNKFSCF